MRNDLGAPLDLPLFLTWSYALSKPKLLIRGKYTPFMETNGAVVDPDNHKKKLICYASLGRTIYEKASAKLGRLSR